MKILLAMILLAVGAFGRPQVTISGGENSRNAYFGDRPAYVFLKYRVDGEKERWVGLFCNSFADFVKTDEEAHGYALKARNLSIAKTVTVVSAPILLFMGINELNRSIRTEAGENDLSQASTGGIILASSGFGMLVTSGIFWLVEKSMVRKSAAIWNNDAKLGFSPSIRLNQDLRWDFAQGATLSIEF